MYLASPFSQQIGLPHSAAPNLSASMSGQIFRFNYPSELAYYLSQLSSSLDLFHFFFNLGCCLLGCVLASYLYLLSQSFSSYRSISRISILFH